MARDLADARRGSPSASGQDPSPMFQDVLESILAERPLNATLNLVARRVSEQAGFDFCAILLPDAANDRVRIAGSYNFPPRYAERANQVFTAALNEIGTSPTARALAERRTVIIQDTTTDPTYTDWKPLAVEFGFRCLVSVPLIPHNEPVGILNVYSQHPFEADKVDLAPVEALARHASLALRVTTLVDARQETIAELRRVNDELSAHRRMLERAHQIHLRLTEAVLTGAGFDSVADTLAELIARPVAIADPDGRAMGISTPAPEWARQGEPVDLPHDLDALVGEGVAGDAPPFIVAPIRIDSEHLGYVIVRAGGTGSRALDERAVEHAATVVALDIMKSRAARTAEERLRSDFLVDLISGGEPDERIAERARHYGLRIGAPHRIVALNVLPGSDLPAGRRPAVVQRTADQLTARLHPALLSQLGGSITAAVPTETMADAVAELRTHVLEAGRAVARIAPGTTVLAGIGGEATGPGAFATSHAQALRCVDLLRRLERHDEVVAIDELGILGLFVEHQRPEDLVALADQVLGPALESDGRSGGALVPTVEQYLDADCSMRDTAARMFIHLNTAKYRVRRLEELCGVDLRRPDDLLKVKIALLSHRLLGPGRAAP